jgi:hypothetical protein
LPRVLIDFLPVRHMIQLQHYLMHLETMYFSKRGRGFQDRQSMQSVVNPSSVCVCTAQLFTGARGINAATGLFRKCTTAGIVDERFGSLGHVAFTAVTARRTHVKDVAASPNAVAHALGGLLRESSTADT